MFSILAVTYLFLGGAGAGCVAVCALLDLLWVKEPFGPFSASSIDAQTPIRRLASIGFATGFGVLVFGVLCLVFDMGRTDRLASLFTEPRFTYVTLGAYLLVGLIVCAAFLALVRFAYLPRIRRSVVVAVEVASVVLGAAVMVYTGLLLQSFGTVHLWSSVLVPVLFTASSLSCGIALVLACSLFVETDTAVARMRKRLNGLDLVVIVIEAALAGLYLWRVAAGVGGSGADVSSLAQGQTGAWWWIGFVACGMVVPAAIEVAAGRFSLRDPRAFACAAAFVLIGGFCLRYAIVDAGAHRALQLEGTSSATPAYSLTAPAAFGVYAVAGSAAVETDGLDGAARRLNEMGARAL